MNALKTIDILESIIPISRFNKGEANKIFAEVKAKGTRIVVKNNVPECILMSPEEYQCIMEEYENAVLLAEAEKRSIDTAKQISHEEILQKYGLSENELNDIDVDLE